MANTNESDAPAAATPPAAASAPVATRSSRTGLGVAGIAGVAVGTVLAAALLFGGGVAVGVALPGGEIGQHSAAGQNGPRPGDRDGARPGDHDGARPGDRDRDRQHPPIGGDRPLHEHHDTDETGDAEVPDDGSAEN